MTRSRSTNEVSTTTCTPGRLRRRSGGWPRRRRCRASTGPSAPRPAARPGTAATAASPSPAVPTTSQLGVGAEQLPPARCGRWRDRRPRPPGSSHRHLQLDAGARRPAANVTGRLPPAASARSRMIGSPMWPSARRAGQLPLVEAAAVVGHQQRAPSRCVWPTLTLTCSAPACAPAFAQRLLRGAEHQLLGLGRQRQVRLHVDLDVDAARRQRRGQVGQRRRQAAGRAAPAGRSRSAASAAGGSRFGCRRRPLPAPAAAPAPAGPARSRRPSGRSGRRAPGRRRRGGRPRSGRRSWSEASIARCSSSSRSRWAFRIRRRHPPGQRDLQQRHQQQRDDPDRREPPHQAAAVAGDRARAQVLLVQHRRAVLGAQAEVDRGEVAQAALVGVLGLDRSGTSAAPCCGRAARASSSAPSGNLRPISRGSSE